VQRCELASDGCTDWGHEDNCPDDAICTGDACPTCNNPCSDYNLKRCNGSTVERCQTAPATDCSEWTAVQTCSENEKCNQGVCVLQCTVSGEVCSDPTQCCSGSCESGHCAAPSCAAGSDASCTDTSSCQSGFVCGSGHTCCRPPISKCTSSAECCLGSTCESGYCQGLCSDISCTLDDSDRLFERYPCANDSDCCGMTRCSAGRCMVICVSSDDCENVNSWCDSDGRCVT